jgi:hypothetical protein
MASLGTILKRTVFWSYERGTWQYDLAVVVILIFVFLPKDWFHDQPRVGLPNTPDRVQIVAISDAGHRQVYRVDARVLAPPEKTPALQNDLHNALKKALPDLSNGRFSITNIEPVRDDKGTVIAYEVEIRH